MRGQKQQRGDRDGDFESEVGSNSPIKLLPLPLLVGAPPRIRRLRLLLDRLLALRPPNRRLAGGAPGLPRRRGGLLGHRDLLREFASLFETY